jgi:hypothetical protein
MLFFAKTNDNKLLKVPLWKASASIVGDSLNSWAILMDRERYI